MSKNKIDSRRQAIQLILDDKFDGNQSKLAKALCKAGFPKTKQQHVHNWLHRSEFNVSAFYAIALAKLSGGLVKASQINPDVADK